MMSLAERCPLKEIMDLEDRPEAEQEEAYRYIRWVNCYLGGSRVILRHLRRYCKAWPKSEAIWILDVGTGSADIPRAVADWARNMEWKVRVVALDLNPKALEFAKRDLDAYPEIQLMKGDVFHLPFSPKSFDYVISSMFFHHLTDSEIPEVLRRFEHLAKRGIIVNDLERRWESYLGIFLLSRLTKNEIFRSDAPLSVARGFRRREMENLIRESRLGYLRYHPHPFYRFSIAGQNTRPD